MNRLSRHPLGLLYWGTLKKKKKSLKSSITEQSIPVFPNTILHAQLNSLLFKQSSLHLRPLYWNWKTFPVSYLVIFFLSHPFYFLVSYWFIIARHSWTTSILDLSLIVGYTRCFPGGPNSSHACVSSSVLSPRTPNLGAQQLTWHLYSDTQLTSQPEMPKPNQPEASSPWPKQ